MLRLTKKPTLAAVSVLLASLLTGCGDSNTYVDACVVTSGMR